MALTLTFNGDKSVLSADYFPTIQLENDYVCGLVDFQTYNSIPNIDLENNLFHIGGNVYEIPTGSYEIEDISQYLLKKIGSNTFSLKANINTLNCEINSSMEIFTNKERSVCQLLGFSKEREILMPNIIHISDLPVNIMNVNIIRVECNIVSSSYINNQQSHTLHEFALNVGPGYKIVEIPKNVIYLPVNVKEITSITLKILDQNDNLINFRGETITIRLHLQRQPKQLQ